MSKAKQPPAPTPTPTNPPAGSVATPAQPPFVDFADRYGRTFAEARKVQAHQLLALEQVLTPACHKALSRWVHSTSTPCQRGEAWPKGVHNVPLGAELLNWVMAHGEFLLE